MYNVKFSNGKIMSFSSKDNLLQYISKNWGVQAHQIVIKDKYISKEQHEALIKKAFKSKEFLSLKEEMLERKEDNMLVC